MTTPSSTTPPQARRSGRIREFLLGLSIGVAALVVGWKLAGPSADPATETVTAAEPTAAVGPSAAPALGSLSPTEQAAASARAHAGAAVPDDVVREISDLRDQASRSGSTVARRRLALSLLEAEQYYPAYELATELIAEDPDDLEALYVTAAVRVRMGQPSRALPLLDRVLAKRPDHVGALVAQGKALQRAGHGTLAVASWQRALPLAGDSAPEIEALLASAGDASD